MLVQDFVSGQACCMNQYHYEWRKQRVVMWFVHPTGKTWYIFLYQHTMYVICLSNISIKTNFKQITNVDLKLTILYNTVRKNTFCAWRHVICCRTFTNVTLLFDHFQCNCTIVQQHFFLNVDYTVARNIKTICPLKWEYEREFPIHNMNEWTLNSCIVYVAYIGVFFPAFHWYDVMTK